MTPALGRLHSQQRRGSAFTKRGDAFFATASAGGPWHEGHCHGGAVAGLMAFVAAQVPSRTPMGLARLSIDLFGPVPTAAAIVPRLVIDKDGARTQHIQADLLIDDRIVARGSALRVRRTNSIRRTSSGAPADQTKIVRAAPGGFAGSFDVVVERGGIAEPGPGRVWFRLTHPLVDGEPVDAVAHAVATAYFSSAIGMNRDFGRFVFPSIDLTVGFARAPVGEWILVDASSHDCDEGWAICHATLSDALGAFAQVVQTSFVERRPDSQGQAI